MSAARDRRKVQRYVDDCERTFRELLPGYEPFPREALDSAYGRRLAVECMVALARALGTGLTGGDACAVFSEHVPDVGP